MKIKLPLRKPGPPLKRPPQLKLKASVARSRRAPVIEEEDFLEEPEPNMRLSHAFVVVLVLHVIAVAGVFAFNSIKARQTDIFSAIKEEPAQSAAASSAESTSAPTVPTAGDTSDPSNGAVQPAAGNPIAPAPVASAPKTYELQPGETLTKVATAFDVSVADLKKLNNITDPKTIRAGTVLMIPETGIASAKPAAAVVQPNVIQPGVAQPAAVAPSVKTSAIAAPAANGVKDSGKIYVMVKGDNPVRIAKRFKVSYASLLSLNNITDPNHMQIGQKLKIPAAPAK